MCGLAALIEPGREWPKVLLDGVEQDLFHRGPDSGGRLVEPGLALVFRRLSILDPRAEADQPMSDASGRCTLVYNGEIFNYRELRRALEAEGVRLRTTGDTEVILEGYLRWGEGVLDRLEGMYAFVLLDRAKHAVIAARDPFGIKPLYLARLGRFVGLASEMRPLLRIVPAEPDPEALAELLTFNWAAGRFSNLKHIERIPGGTVLTVSLADGEVRERRFCDPLDTLEPDPRLVGEAAVEAAEAALRRSVTAHLASDVGYAVQLSGGVDSSLVTAYAAAATQGPLATFGIFLKGYLHDERPFREQVVARLGVLHHEIEMNGRDFADALPRAVRHMEGPSPHYGCVLLMRLCDEIRKTNKVVLTGEGADEMFGGYRRYGRWRKLAWQGRLARVLPREAWPSRSPFVGIRRVAGRDTAAYAAVNHDFEAMHRLFPALVPKPGAREHASRRYRAFRDRLLAVDQIAHLESLLVRQDKMAMAASVEARVPFVHMPLARVVNRIPPSVRIPGGETKPILKQIASRVLPRAAIYRPKIGLQTPTEEWLKDADGLGRYLDDLAAPDARLAAYAEPRRLRGVVDAFRGGREEGQPAVMRLVNIECWLRSLPAAPRAGAA